MSEGLVANPERGETAVKLGDKTFTMVMDQNAIRSLEAELSTNKRDAVYHEILAAANRGQYRAISGLLWASLQRHHPEMTMDRVDDLITKVGGMSKLNTALKSSLKASAPTEEDVTAVEGDKKRPRKA